MYVKPVHFTWLVQGVIWWTCAHYKINRAWIEGSVHTKIWRSYNMAWSKAYIHMLVMQCSIMLSPLLHHPQCTLRQCHQLTQCPPWSVSPWSLHLCVHSKRQLPIYQLQSDQWRLCKEGSGIAYDFSAQMRTDMPHLHMYIPVYSILSLSCTVCTSTSTLHCVGVHNYIYVY